MFICNKQTEKTQTRFPEEASAEAKLKERCHSNPPVCKKTGGKKYSIQLIHIL